MKKFIALLTTVLLSLNAQATLLSIELNQSDYQVGDVLTADIVISDIEENYGLQTLLASFEFNITWDSAILGYSSATFGTKLDVDPDPFWASDQNVSTSSNNIALSEVSYALSSDLFTAQNGLASFVLASVNFTVIGAGIDSLTFANVTLGDDFYTEFSQLTSMDKSYTVTAGNPVNVPEPSTIILMLMALILLTKQVTNSAIKKG